MQALTWLVMMIFTPLMICYWELLLGAFATAYFFLRSIRMANRVPPGHVREPFLKPLMVQPEPSAHPIGAGSSRAINRAMADCSTTDLAPSSHRRRTVVTIPIHGFVNEGVVPLIRDSEFTFLPADLLSLPVGERECSKSMVSSATVLKTDAARLLSSTPSTCYPAPSLQCSEVLATGHLGFIFDAFEQASCATASDGLLTWLLCMGARLIGLCHNFPRLSHAKMKIAFCLLCLMLARSSSAQAYSNAPLRKDVHHDFALKGQISNACWSSQCGSGYFSGSFINVLQQTTCSPGAYVYAFTITSGSGQFGYPVVNIVSMSCSNGETLSQGQSPPTITDVRQIMSASGFNSTTLAPGCILNRMRIDGVDFGFLGYYGATIYSCNCTSGASVVGLTQNYYDTLYPTFSSFGIVCDNAFCTKGQYYSNGFCISCPAGLMFILL